MCLDMTKKNILLTGYSSGIGRALALELSHAGYILGLVGRSQDKFEALLSEIPSDAQKNTSWISADLANSEEVATVVERFQKPVDILINCAGVSVTGKIEDIPLSEFNRCWKVNFQAPVSLIQQVLPQMKQRRTGEIVNVSSGVAIRALPYIAPYASAKAALNSFTDSLRVEIASFGIRVLLFSPGPVASQFHENIKHYGEQHLASPRFHGEAAEKVAQILFKALQSNKNRVTLGTRAKLARHLQYWSPTNTDKILKRLYRLE
jgi:short-subunit dehydrogenase